MIEKETDLICLLEKTLKKKPEDILEETGIVVKVADVVCKIYGLTNALLGEVITFENGGKGVVLDLSEDFVSVILFEGVNQVFEQEIAKRTKKTLKVSVGENLIGRVLNSVGTPIDLIKDLKLEKKLPIEDSIVNITERSSITDSLETGIIAVDSLTPIGLGQRMLLLGDRGTGKTTLAFNTILNQKNKSIICIYVSIGQRQIDTARLILSLEKYGSLSYTIVVEADAKEPPLNKFLAPYVGCTIGQYFMNQGKNVLIVYDDLSKHAEAYREISLLLKRPPGREAYPGDIFYIHSRLLERSGKLSSQLGGGSMTAIPIIQTKENDFTSYISTNLISITDGQVILDSDIFNRGIKPAINNGLSISRISPSIQHKMLRFFTSSLKLELAQYQDLLVYSQFESDLSKISQDLLDRGRRATEILKQPQDEVYPITKEILLLFLLKENFLDRLNINEIKQFAVQFVSYVEGTHHELYNQISQQRKDFSPNLLTKLRTVAEEFHIIYSSKIFQESK